MSQTCEKCGHHAGQLISSDPVRYPSIITSETDVSPAQLRANLDEIKSTIFLYQTQTYLNVLGTQQRALEMELSHVVYPVLTLPTEIITRIFVECLPSDEFVRPSPSKPPLTLAQICSRWRDISLSTRGVWSSIFLHFSSQSVGSTYSSESVTGAHLLFETWVSRAKGHPLSLSLSSSNEALPDETMSLISSLSSQLVRLDLRLSSADFDYLGENTTSFPRLQRLALDHYNDSTHAPESWISVVENAPALCGLRIGGVPPSVSDLQHYPFLNTVELEILSVQTLADMLNHLPRLRHLTLHLDERIDGSQALTTAPHLQSLTIIALPHTGDTSTSAISVLDSLKVPGLRCLELRTDLPCSNLTSFLARSSCTLEHLTVGYSAASEPAELMQCLQAIPALMSLEIDVDLNLPAVVKQMALHPSILPRLSALTLRGLRRHYPNDTPDHNYIPLLNLLRVRRNPSDPSTTKLSVFQLYVEQDPFEYDWLRDDIILAKFSQLIAQGLKVELTYADDSQWPLT